MGVSRSASVAVAYLMWRYQLSFEAALLRVKQAGAHAAKPNPGFERQLREFEQSGWRLTDGKHEDPQLPGTGALIVQG